MRPPDWLVWFLLVLTIGNTVLTIYLLLALTGV
jgi:hypothetical protein